MLQRCLVTLLLVAAAATSACSRRVAWEEEVALRTGEHIWVRRTAEYTLQGQAGNPFAVAWAPARIQSLEFNVRQKRFRYTGDARVMLLALDPNGLPVLVARADDNQWGWQHGYRCTVPYYVQLVPDLSGTNWTWPNSPGAWLYGMPANLMVSPPPLGKAKARYTAAESLSIIESLDFRNASLKHVDAGHSADLCP